MEPASQSTASASSGSPAASASAPAAALPPSNIGSNSGVPSRSMYTMMSTSQPIGRAHAASIAVGSSSGMGSLRVSRPSPSTVVSPTGASQAASPSLPQLPAPLSRARSRSLGAVQSGFLQKQLKKERMTGRARTTTLAQAQAVMRGVPVTVTGGLRHSPKVDEEVNKGSNQWASPPGRTMLSPSSYSSANLPPRSSISTFDAALSSAVLSSDNLSSSPTPSYASSSSSMLKSAYSDVLPPPALMHQAFDMTTLIPELGGRAQSASSSLRRLNQSLSATSSPHASDNDFLPAELMQEMGDISIGTGEFYAPSSAGSLNDSMGFSDSSNWMHPEGGLGSGYRVSTQVSQGSDASLVTELDEIDMSLILMRNIHERSTALEQKILQKHRQDSMAARQAKANASSSSSSSSSSAASRENKTIAEEEEASSASGNTPPEGTEPSKGFGATPTAAAAAVTASPIASPQSSPSLSPMPSPSLPRHSLSEVQILNRQMEKVIALLYKSKLSLSLRTVQLRRLMREQFLSDLHPISSAPQTADDVEIARWIASSALSTLEIDEAQGGAAAAGGQEDEEEKEANEEIDSDDSDDESVENDEAGRGQPIDPSRSSSNIQSILVSLNEAATPAVNSIALPPLRTSTSSDEMTLPNAPSFPPPTHTPLSGGSGTDHSASPFSAQPHSATATSASPSLVSITVQSASPYAAGAGATELRSATPIINPDELNISQLIGSGFNTKRGSAGAPMRKGSVSELPKNNNATSQSNNSAAAASASAATSAGSSSPMMLSKNRAAAVAASTGTAASPVVAPTTLPSAGHSSPSLSASSHLAQIPLTAFALVNDPPGAARSVSHPPSPSLVQSSISSGSTLTVGTVARSISDNKLHNNNNNNNNNNNSSSSSSSNNSSAVTTASSTPRRPSRIYFTLTPPVTEFLHKVWQWEFDLWGFVELVPDTPLTTLCCYLLERWGLFSTFNIDRATFHRFISVIEEGYLDNAYHNKIHAADVVQNVHVLLLGFMQKPGRESVGALCTSLTPLDVFSSIIAAAIHDYKHTGTCFCEETRLLTNKGFLFGAEIRERLERGEELLFACFDVAQQQYVYRPCVGNKLSVDFIPAPHLIEFTAASDSSAEEGAIDGGGVSVRVTPNHVMYAQWGQSSDDDEGCRVRHDAKGSEIPFSYLDSAGSPLRADFFLRHGSQAAGVETEEERPSAMRLLTSAARGVARTAAEQAELFSILADLGVKACSTCACGSAHPAPCELLAFLELYGFALHGGQSNGQHTAQVQELLLANSNEFAPWVLRLFNGEQLRSLIRGLWRATGSDSPSISTSSLQLRDQIQIALLHAGYACTVRSASRDGCAEQSWSLTFADAQSKEGRKHTMPTLSCARDVNKVSYAGRIWCVTVDHPDHLVVAQRAQVDPLTGTVLRQSQPLIIGQTNLFHTNTVSDLAIRYNDASVLENMHLAEAFDLILRHKEYDIFSSFTREQRRECRETIIQMVLATGQ